MVLQKKKELAVFFLIVLVGVIATLYFPYFSFQESSPAEEPKVVMTNDILRIQHKESPLTFEESRALAEFLLRSAPTFFFDGIPSTLAYTGSVNASCQSCWNHSFSFISEHPGYGSVDNRGSAALMNFTFAHNAVVVMEGKYAREIVLDNIWDDISQKFISG